jgi:hypothetical protein
MEKNDKWLTKYISVLVKQVLIHDEDWWEIKKRMRLQGTSENCIKCLSYVIISVCLKVLERLKSW